MMDWNDGSGWGGWLAMTLMMLVFWGAVIALVVVLVRNSMRPNAKPTSRRAEDVLADRFARGQIDESEYQDRLAVLQGTPDPCPRLEKTRAG